MSQNISIMGANYQNVPAVELPKTGGGKATFTDVSDTTAAAGDVLPGKSFYTSNGTKVQGTGSNFTITEDTVFNINGTTFKITLVT